MYYVGAKLCFTQVRLCGLALMLACTAIGTAMRYACFKFSALYVFGCSENMLVVGCRGGNISNMNSPVFNKVKEAVEIVNLARKLEDHALSPHSVLMQGRDDTHLHVDYVPETGGITLAFVGALMTAHTVRMC
jgi:hypothetical protein